MRSADRACRSCSVLAVCWVVLLLPASATAAGELPPEQSQTDAHVLWLGRNVLAVADAISNPESPGAMEAVLALGHDSRYYVMVRGWLTMQLDADMSILEAGQGDASHLVTSRIAFLRKAIRAIDLE